MITLKWVSLTILQLPRQCVPTLSPRQLIRIFSPNLQHSFPKPHPHLLTSLFIQLGVKRNNTKILHILLYKSISLNLYPYTLVSYLQQKERPCSYQRQLLFKKSAPTLFSLSCAMNFYFLPDHSHHHKNMLSFLPSYKNKNKIFPRPPWLVQFFAPIFRKDSTWGFCTCHLHTFTSYSLFSPR